MQQGDQALAIRMQKTVIARPPKSLGQHMLQHQPQKIRTGHGALLHPPGLGVLEAEAYQAVTAGDDILFANDPTIKIAPQIDQRRLACTDGFAVHHPVFRVAARPLQSSGFDAREQLRPKDLGQRLMAEQITALAFAGPFRPPAPILAIDRRRRHHQMDMRVIIQSARVRMQHGNDAGRALKLLVVLAEGAHRLPATAHQQLIDDLLVRESQRPEFGGQGERHQEILGRHLLLHLAFQPLLTLMVLAMRAVAVAAGMRYQRLMFAFGAFDLHLQTRLRAAMRHRRQGAQVVKRQFVPVLRQEVRLESDDHGSQPDHLTFPQSMEKLSIRPLMRSMA